ncbi:MAG: Peptide chain release factor 2 [Candidatus Omnitrophica bacterium]|nr:Peptide chain release factor 2 [Candidatus Omnitrophota bacterium]
MRWGGFFDVERLVSRIGELEHEIALQDFWTRPDERRNPVIQELKSLKNQVTPYIELQSQQNELKGLLSIVEDGDEDSLGHVVREAGELSKRIELLEFQKLLSGPEDRNNAILSINAGAGGTESCDWVSMLLRMYSRWAEDQSYKIETLDLLPGEEAGVKNVTLLVQGAFAYGYLRSENGVHRLVRISPFDANKRRHTSFCSVEVIPEVDDDIKIDIKESELRIDVFRSQGKGGQGVNTTDSAVRITHLPTGIVVQCQNERSQLKNKATALKILKSRIHDKEMAKRFEEQQKAYGEKQEIAWGSQIRSYVLHPYNLVKDHRTDHETSDAQGVLDGDLDAFLEAYLRKTGSSGAKTRPQ